MSLEMARAAQPKFAFVFPGQGAQYVGMARDLVAVSPAARQVFAHADEVLGFALSALCFTGPQAELDDTANAQPATLVVSLACLAALDDLRAASGVALAPDVVAGHSLGEFSALVAAGALPFEDALRLVYERGRLMRESAGLRPGGMAAVVGLDAAALDAICAEVAAAGVATVANINSPNQVVLSGELLALQRAMELARARGARLVQRLAVSIPAHSPLMEPVARHFSAALARYHIRPPRVPLISNGSARLLTSADELRRELSEQLTRPVHWIRTVETAMGYGVRTFVELGPRHVLTSLIRRIRRDARPISLSDAELATLLGDER